MEFGIWVEPEMINPDSDLYRAHPDWVLALPGYARATGRHQLVLNLNIPQAFDYLVERMSWLLGEHAVDYVKWDMNRELVQPVAQGQSRRRCPDAPVLSPAGRAGRAFPAH